MHTSSDISIGTTNKFGLDIGPDISALFDENNPVLSSSYTLTASYAISASQAITVSVPLDETKVIS